MDRVSLTKREEELMSFLWDFGEPLTVRAMLDFCPKRTWSDNYLNVMIRSLEKKGAIEACDMMRYSRQYARAFRPVLGWEEYYIYMAVNHGADAALLAQAAVAFVLREKPENMDQLLQELEKVLEEYRKNGWEKGLPQNCGSPFVSQL